MTENKVGNYRLIAELGRGGMADVFLAVTEKASTIQFEKLAVIKRLRDTVAQDPEFVTMLRDEARIAARLNHPNVVQTIEVGEADGEVFLAMEYLDGQPLSRVLARARATLPLEIHCAILCDVLAGLHYAHELKDYDGTSLNVVHRDATPHNVFVTYDGVVKVVDFGIAKAVGRSSQTRHGVVKGKVAYMAPEQARNAILDRRADLFAVGVMLWEAATRQRMWMEQESEVFSKLLRGEVRASPRAVEASVSATLDTICKRALAVKPEDRYATAADFEEALEAFMKVELPRPTNREIGKLLTEVFADKREITKQVIESQLTELRSKRQAEVVSIEPALRVTGETPVVDRPSHIDDVLPFEATQVAPSTRGAPVSRAKPQAAIVEAKKRSPIVLVVAIGVVLAMCGAAAFLLFRHPTPDPIAVQSITVTLRATPQETRFSIDNGAELPNPYTGSLVRDSLTHTVKASAPGFATKTETVSFEQDVSMRFSLARESKPTSAAIPSN